jgi:predicted RNA-binding Zn-ribbon protein involved in translation (DUF1610 family)
MPKKTKWRCPECGATVITYVRVSVPPACENPARHSSRLYQMEEIGGTK